ncbi:glycosyltransferase [Salipaludibacillus keqinensis]|uniref:Glycosyltransferase n=1 Tax=Salipaludibacillus keqinensis TaxID=2045207 RepID=A0A323TJE1_9BACI|nr:glycosyltransferase family 2 protein [Salipaludibacillus keqinensis]PYZ95071.1 glycosyltransferase [Salipaludibacillus keqinensis]
MKKLTIFTPTYNRAYCLDQCYKSLVRQTNQNFTWLVIDDGSTDDTSELIETWIQEGKIDLQYVKQANQGMHGAHNTAYERIETELNVCLDSDDYFHQQAVENIVSFWEKNGSDKVSGFVALNADEQGKVIGTSLPSHLTSATLFDLYHTHGVTGDKKLVYRSTITRKYPYPLFADESYVGLAYKYYKLDEEFPLLLMNKVVCIVDYRPDGSSMNMFKQYKKNPKGFAFYRKQLMLLSRAKWKFKYRQCIHYVSSSLLSRNKNFLKETPLKGLTIAAMPIGAALFFYIHVKTLKM